MQDGRDTEPVRRFLASVIQWGGWGTCVGIGSYAILSFDPNHGHFAPQWVGLVFIFAMGVAIAGTLARSRMRLTSSILHAFQAGQEAQKAETDRRVAEITRKLDGERIKKDG